MPFDYKKEYKEFYLPKNKPSIIEVPKMNYLAVRGRGDPNSEDSEYKQSIGLLYAIAFTVKMSKKGSHKIEGYFDYVVPPLEGFWWQDVGKKSNTLEIDYSRKADFNFISLIRLPDFVTKSDFDWAISEATEKAARKSKTPQGQSSNLQPKATSLQSVAQPENSPKDFSRVEFLTYDEGLCVQCMHLGSYDDEPETVKLMHQYIAENGYKLDIQNPRYHHEIYLSDPRRCQVDKLKTVIRHPIQPSNS